MLLPTADRMLVGIQLILFSFVMLLFLSLGQGLTLVASVLGGDVVTRQDDVESAKLLMGCAMKEEKCNGLSEVIVSKDVACGISYL